MNMNYLLLYIAVALAVIVVGRDVLLVGAGFYVKYISLKPPVSVHILLSEIHST